MWTDGKGLYSVDEQRDLHFDIFRLTTIHLNSLIETTSPWFGDSVTSLPISVRNVTRAYYALGAFALLRSQLPR